MSRAPAEIARVLGKAKAEGVSVCAFFPSFTFQGQLVIIDPRAGRIVLTRSPIEVKFPMPATPARIVYWARWADATGEVGPFSKSCDAGIVCSRRGAGLRIEDQRDRDSRRPILIIERLDTPPLLEADAAPPRQLPEAA